MGVASMRALLAILAVAVSMAHGSSSHVHHVVGGDRGWDPSSNLGDWSSGKVFKVGDKIWFTYSAASDAIAEVSSRDEFESCDLNNPIRMYTDGLNQVTLDSQGTRYFTSSSPESCKNGLKLHVEVQPQADADAQATSVASVTPVTVHAVAAAGPTPSGSSITQVSSTTTVWSGLLLLCFMGFGRF